MEQIAENTADSLTESVKEVNQFTQYFQGKMPGLMDLGIKLVIVLIAFFVCRKIIQLILKIFGRSFERAGIGLGLLFQVPQILIYVPLFLWMMEEADKKSRQFAYLRKIGTAGKNNRRYFLCFFVALSVLFLGILTESYAGSGLVQMILRIVY